MIGVGVIIRDYVGSVMAALSKRLPLLLDPLKAKAKSIHVSGCINVHKCVKWKKVTNFTHFEQKNTHINGCKLVYICKLL